MKFVKKLAILLIITLLVFSACGGGGGGNKDDEPDDVNTNQKGIADEKDINGDGYADIAIGAIYYNYNESENKSDGRVYIYYGSSTGPGNTPSVIIESPVTGTDACFGRYVILDDFNNDGYDDIAVAAKNFYSNSGKVYIYYGSASGPGTTPDTVITQTSQYFPSSICSGDFNNDGYADLAMGNTNERKVYILNGGTAKIADCNLDSDTPDATCFVTGENPGSFLTAGDFDGDNDYDLAAADENDPKVYIFQGSTSGVSESATSINIGTNLISSLTTGDINNDGYDDLVAGSSSYSSSKGIVYVYHGSDSGLSGSADTTLEGINSGDRFGSSLSIGDINKDGYADLTVGAEEYKIGSDNGVGAVYLYKGSSSGINSTEWMHFYGKTASSYLGYAVTLCDVTGDGYQDLYVIAQGYDWDVAGPLQGRVYFFTGSSTSTPLSGSWYCNAEIQVD